MNDNSTYDDAEAAQVTLDGTPQRVRRVLIVDGHPIVWQGLRHLTQYEDDLIVCGEAASARDARAAILKFNPDILICDIKQPDTDGVELVRHIRAHHPHLPILILSSQDEKIYAERMLAVGANGYISKQASSEELLASLRRVLDGKIYVSADVGTNMIQAYATGSSPVVDPIDRLSSRELQVLSLIGAGKSTREAALSLNLSVKTVESHRQRIKRKLNLVTATQLIRYAVLVSTRTD
jgi:DNA-binding NarL/FixJ family response regulator